MQIFSVQVKIFSPKSLFLEMSLVLSMENVFYDNISDMTRALEGALEDADILEITKANHKEVCTEIKEILETRSIEDFHYTIDFNLTIQQLHNMIGNSKFILKTQFETIKTDLPTSDLCEIYEGHLFNMEYICELYLAYETRCEFLTHPPERAHLKAQYLVEELTKVYTKMAHLLKNDN